ncbi:MAG: hypothetical protein AAGA48_34910 [Myxococcota bacterium]
MGLLFFGIVGSSVFFGLQLGTIVPWEPAWRLLLQLPLAVLSLRGGARLDRIRRASASLALFAGALRTFRGGPWDRSELDRAGGVRHLRGRP